MPYAYDISDLYCWRIFTFISATARFFNFVYIASGFGVSRSFGMTHFNSRIGWVTVWLYNSIFLKELIREHNIRHHTHTHTRKHPLAYLFSRHLPLISSLNIVLCIQHSSRMWNGYILGICEFHRSFAHSGLYGLPRWLLNLNRNACIIIYWSTSFYPFKFLNNNNR